MNEIDIKQKKNHVINIENRKNLSLSGVLSVENFNDKSVNINTSYGLMYIEGSGLVVNKFNIDDGMLSIDGQINSIKYIERAEKVGFFKRIFK
jgi:sporulation protein YabP